MTIIHWFLKIIVCCISIGCGFVMSVGCSEVISDKLFQTILVPQKFYSAYARTRALCVSNQLIYKFSILIPITATAARQKSILCQWQDSGELEEGLMFCLLYEIIIIIISKLKSKFQRQLFVSKTVRYNK